MLSLMGAPGAEEVLKTRPEPGGVFYLDFVVNHKVTSNHFTQRMTMNANIEQQLK